MRRRLTALAAAALLTAVPASAQAPTYADNLRLTLNYDGRLIVKVLDVRIEQTVADGRFQSNVRLVSYGLLSLFKRLDQRAFAEGTVREGEPRPGFFRHRNLQTRLVRVRWTGNDAIATAEPDYPNVGEPPATRAQRSRASDPLTHLLGMTLSPGSRNPCQAGTRHFFDGRQTYDLDFTYVGPRQLDRREQRLGLTSGIRCSVRYREVAGFRRRPPAEQNEGLRTTITTGFARYGEGGPWVLSSLRAGTRLGDAVIELQRANVVYR